MAKKEELVSIKQLDHLAMKNLKQPSNILFALGSGNTNIIIGLRQEEFASDDDKITNSVLWRSKNGNAKHNEIRLKGEGRYDENKNYLHVKNG
jgi:hypothetical protein